MLEEDVTVLTVKEIQARLRMLVVQLGYRGKPLRSG